MRRPIPPGSDTERFGTLGELTSIVLMGEDGLESGRNPRFPEFELEPPEPAFVTDILLAPVSKFRFKSDIMVSRRNNCLNNNAVDD